MWEQKNQYSAGKKVYTGKSFTQYLREEQEGISSCLCCVAEVRGALLLLEALLKSEAASCACEVHVHLATDPGS